VRIFTGEPFGTDTTAAHASALTARTRMSGLLHETPIVRSHALDELAGCEVGLKVESFQRTGSYKPRGAFSSLLAARERDELPPGGVIVDSSGNYGQAVALAASIVGVPATIVVPDTTNPLKIAACEGYGATVIRDGVDWSNRGPFAQRLAAEGDLLYLPADAWDGMAGDATITLELFDAGESFDTLLVPLSSGGLIAGIAIVAKHLDPDLRIVGVQPSASGHAIKSLRSGRVEHLSAPPDTIADGARTLALGERPFSIIREHVDEVVLVDDEWTLWATWLIMTKAKVVVEPTAALPLAALLSGQVGAGRAICLASGGNLNLDDIGPRLARAGFASGSRPRRPPEPQAITPVQGGRHGA
jgi:threonine dehydratase